MTDVPLLHIVMFTSTPAELPGRERRRNLGEERMNVWPEGFGSEPAEVILDQAARSKEPAVEVDGF